MHELPSFFDLPREIRDQILFYFCGDKYVTTSKPDPPFWHCGKLRQMAFDGNSRFSDRDLPRYFEPTAALLSMLEVSHQFYDEAVAAFYSRLEFHFRDVIPFGRLLATLPIEYQTCIRELDLHISTEEVDQWLAILKEKAATHLSGLRTVHITIEIRTVPYTSFKNFNNLCFNTSKSLPLLREAIISIQYHYAESESEAFSRQDAEEIFERVADRLR